mgnify:CR=1 FL=1|jgi:Flp pilus assembly protein TadD
MLGERMNRIGTYALAGAALGLVGLVTGCAGNGGYTSEHASLAKQKMSVMKAATEWDMARQAFLAGDLEKAIDKIDESMAYNDQVPKSHVLKGRILLEQGDIGGAIESLRTAEALDPQFVDAHYYLGVVHERLGELEKALTHYRLASEYDGYNPDYAVAAAEMLVDMGRLGEARSYLEGGPSFEHHAGVRQTLGHIALIEGNPQEAVALFAEARLLAPSDDVVLEDLIRAQVATNNFREAEFNLSTLLSDEENAARRDLQHMRAQCLMALDRPVEARKIYYDLTKGQAGQADIEAWVGLGNVSYVLSDGRSLRRAASRVVALAPDRHEGYSLTALWFRSQGDNQSALESARDAVAAAPRDASVLAFEGMLLMEMGRLGEARESLASATSLEPGNPTFRQLLADTNDLIAAGEGAFAAEEGTTD